MHTTFLVGNNSRLADNRLTNKQLNDLIDYKLCSNICPGGLRLVLSLQWTPEWWTATPMMTNTTIPDKKWQPNWHPTTKPATTSKADFNAESISCFCVSCISSSSTLVVDGSKIAFLCAGVHLLVGIREWSRPNCLAEVHGSAGWIRWICNAPMEWVKVSYYVST